MHIYNSQIHRYSNRHRQDMPHTQEERLLSSLNLASQVRASLKSAAIRSGLSPLSSRSPKYELRDIKKAISNLVEGYQDVDATVDIELSSLILLGLIIPSHGAPTPKEGGHYR